MRHICTVMDQFDLPGKGTAVTCIAADDSLRLQPGNAIVIRRPGLADLEAVVLGFEVLRNDWSPHKPRNFGVLLPAAIGAASIPRESEIWSNA